jgi:aspartate 1-decarboxylase
MEIQVLKSKLHCVTVTQAELDYIGSVTIDEDLMDAANLIENEQVHILNKNNGKIGAAAICNGGGGASSIIVEKL